MVFNLFTNLKDAIASRIKSFISISSTAELKLLVNIPVIILLQDKTNGEQSSSIHVPLVSNIKRSAQA